MPSSVRKKRRNVGRGHQRRNVLTETLIRKPSKRRGESAAKPLPEGVFRQKEQRETSKAGHSKPPSTFSALDDALRLIQEARDDRNFGAAEGTHVSPASKSHHAGAGRSARNAPRTSQRVTDSRASLVPIELVLRSGRYQLDPMGALTEAIQNQR
ncbi:hypothetical protein CCYA_CCYA14G3683 [Cyanidiococcus yangmingshanensis]|nr:hypothetical protein CCYA_CCYA14G3683 [Cyanidiococcus yangmingshanensis]